MKVDAVVALDGYRILCDAIDLGIERGMTRAWKHTTRPKAFTREMEESIKAYMSDCITGEIAEIVKFQDGE